MSLPRTVLALSFALSLAAPALAEAPKKLLLIGQGPDELLGGYKRHLGVHYGKLWRGLPGAARRWPKICGHIPRLRPQYK